MADEFSLIPAMGISASGLDAESRRMEVTANNIANANSTVDANGNIFRRKEIVFAEKLRKAVAGAGGTTRMAGVEVQGIVEDTRAPKRVHRPGHPNADKDGYLHVPNINPVEEMVNMMSATRSYEANLAALKTAKTMARQALEIGK